jgi:hypothetical protein
MKTLKVKSASFEVALTDIPNMVDVLFDLDHKRPGWVIMAANPKGRQHIENMFPHHQIKWREAGPELPEDWREFKVNAPGVASKYGARLPVDVIPTDSIDDSTPEQLAMLLAFGVKRDGGRAAVIDYTRDASPTVMVFSPRGN